MWLKDTIGKEDNCQNKIKYLTECWIYLLNFKKLYSANLPKVILKGYSVINSEEKKEESSTCVYTHSHIYVWLNTHAYTLHMHTLRHMRIQKEWTLAFGDQFSYYLALK